jgi:acyl carrier protein
MTKQELINEVASILLVDAATFTEDTSLDGIPTWDSLSKMGLLTLLSNELDIDVPFDFLDKVKTVKEIAELASSKLS